MLSILEAASVKKDRGDIGQTSDQCKSTSQPVAIQAGRGDISPSSDRRNSTSKPVAIPAGRGDISHLSDQRRYVSQAVNELLANLFTNDHITVHPSSPASIGRPSNACVTSNSTSARQSSSRFDFSDLPITPYRVPSSYIEDMINSLVILSKRKQAVYNLLTRD